MLVRTLIYSRCPFPQLFVACSYLPCITELKVSGVEAPPQVLSNVKVFIERHLEGRMATPPPPPPPPPRFPVAVNMKRKDLSEEIKRARDSTYLHLGLGSCWYVESHTYTCTWTLVHTHTLTHYVHTLHTHTRAHTLTHYVYTYTHYTHLHTHTYTHTHVHTHTCTHYAHTHITHIHTHTHTPHSAVPIGRINSPPNHLQDNIVSGMTTIANRIPRGWRNIQAVHVKTVDSIALPIFNSAPSEATLLPDADRGPERKVMRLETHPEGTL